MGSKKTSQEKYFRILVIAIISSFIVIAVTNENILPIKPLQRLELKFLDEKFSYRGEIKSDSLSDIIIIEINQNSYDQIPARWPWPRSLFAKLIENLNNAGVRAIGVDLIMSDEDTHSLQNDSLLFDTIKKYKNVVVAGKLDIANEQALSQRKSGEANSVNMNVIKKQGNFNYFNIFYSADSSLGIVQVPSDADGVYRRYQPYVGSGVAIQNIPSFGFAVLNKYYGLNSQTTAGNNPKYFEYNGIKIPKYDNTSYLINYLGYNPKNYFKSVDFIDIIDDKEFDTSDEIEFEEQINTWDDPDFGLLYSGLFKDKIVLIGSTMPEDKDLFPVAVSKGNNEGDNLMYGIHLHANAIANVINSNFIIKQSPFEQTILVVVFTFFMFFCSVLLRRNRKRSAALYELGFLAIVLISIFALYQISNLLFANFNYLFPIVSGVLAIVVGYIGSSIYFFLSERKQNTVIKTMFSHYVSSALVNELLADPGKLRLGGEKKDLTILFSDIAGFTPFSQGKTPEELVHFMNDYLSLMTKVVMNHQGTLDKYIGDAIMAFWGAPIPMDNHAYLACSTAVDMRGQLEEVYTEVDNKGNRILDMRIGINSGEVVVGNMGGESRFDYTVMGDNVNLASRLEGANKQYGSHIMISESTYKQVEDRMVARVLDTITVKGRSIPTKVFELIGRKDDPAVDKILGMLENYYRGLEKYIAREFEAAALYFEKSVKVFPKDIPSHTYLERCKIYIENPPDENWNGVFELKSK